MIDVNCDMGEIPEAIANGEQEAMMPHLTSVNIACGGHAGDEGTMRDTLRQAMRWDLKIGAHPGYPDRENFGRLEMDMPPKEIALAIHAQLMVFARIAKEMGARITHVKAHGALYNQAVNNVRYAAAIASGVAIWRRDVVLVGLAGSSMLDVFRGEGFEVAGEAFADRRYEGDGTLRSRKFADALIRDPNEAAEQAVRFAESGGVETICIHGDTPGAVEIAAEVTRTLRARRLTM
jgi:UPF0271 protein